MRCYICNVELSENEIQIDENGKSEPCTACMTVIMDTAYSDGFEPGGPASKQSTLLDVEGESRD